MRIREYSNLDLSRITTLHATSGFNYKLPELGVNEFFSRKLITGDDDEPIMAAFLRKSAEVYLVCDPSWRTPAWRNEAIRQLQIASLADAREHGVKQLLAFLPPQVTGPFGRRLHEHGWTSYQDVEWHCFSKEVD